MAAHAAVLSTQFWGDWFPEDGLQISSGGMLLHFHCSLAVHSLNASVSLYGSAYHHSNVFLESSNSMVRNFHEQFSIGGRGVSHLIMSLTEIGIM